jgi:hypothetical protein
MTFRKRSALFLPVFALFCAYARKKDSQTPWSGYARHPKQITAVIPRGACHDLNSKLKNLKHIGGIEANAHHVPPQNRTIPRSCCLHPL